MKGGRAFWRAIVGGVLAALLVVVLFRAAGKDLFWWHHHTVTLTWKASTSSEVIGYQVYRKVLPSGENTRINATLVNGLSFVDERVESGKRYRYVVRAVANGQESADSAPVEVGVR